MNLEISRFLFFSAVCVPLASAAPTHGAEPPERSVRIVNPNLLAGGDIPAVRVPLGVPDDYKPFAALT